MKHHTCPVHIRLHLFVMAFMVSIFCCGCGYHVGGLAHPQLKTVAVAPVVNDTTMPNISAYMRDAMAERFMVDGTYKLVDMDEADLIVFVTVKSYSLSENGESSYDSGSGLYLPSSWSVNLQSTVSVSIPGRAELLVNNANISQTAKFQNNIDYYLSQEVGLKQACYLTAGTVVSMTTEAW